MNLQIGYKGPSIKGMNEVVVCLGFFFGLHSMEFCLINIMVTLLLCSLSQWLVICCLRVCLPY